MKGKDAVVVVTLLASTLVIKACSVGTAREMDDSIVFPGSTRSVIMSKLGAPETSQKLENGDIQESYLIKKGNEKSSGIKAWAHAGLDLLTFFPWKLVATHYELSEESYRLTVTYGEDGIVKDVQKLGPGAVVTTPDAE